MLYQLLEQAHKLVPNWRLCQLISNLQGMGPQDIFYVTDEELAKGLKKFINNYPKGK